MLYRDYLVLDDKSVDDSGSYSQDLNINLPITELTIDMEIMTEFPAGPFEYPVHIVFLL